MFSAARSWRRLVSSFLLPTACPCLHNKSSPFAVFGLDLPSGGKNTHNHTQTVSLTRFTVASSEVSGVGVNAALATLCYRVYAVQTDVGKTQEIRFLFFRPMFCIVAIVAGNQ